MSHKPLSVESHDADRLLPNSIASGTFFSNPNLDFYMDCFFGFFSSLPCEQRNEKILTFLCEDLSPN